MGTYSFLNVSASITGPGISASIGAGAANAKNSVSVVFDEDKTKTDTGSDGSLMQSLRATQTGTLKFRFQKTSPINAVLSAAYAFQRQSSANWGQNIIRITDKVRGDVVRGLQISFVKFPDNEWNEDGNEIEWNFRGIVTESLGSGGAPGLATP